MDPKVKKFIEEGGKILPAKLPSKREENSEVKDNESVGPTARIREYVDETEGIFTNQMVYSDLGFNSVSKQKYARNVLSRLKKEGIIEIARNQEGSYRRIQTDVEKMNFSNVSIESLDIKLPLGIDEKVYIYPGNIIVVAGDPNAGKTAFLLNIVNDNIEHFNIHYLSSEMGPRELLTRATKFDSFPIRHKNFSAYEIAENQQDMIQPGEGNLIIVDYLEVVEDFWQVARILKKIHEKLKGAVVVVAIQKRDRNSDLPLGGQRSLEKPRLALSISPGKIKIIKGKNWRGHTNPNGLAIRFKLIKGAKFVAQGGWFKEEDKK